MTALEDIHLEETRARVGALIVLTGSAEPVSSRYFLPDFVSGVIYLREEGYLVETGDDGNRSYQLTDEGWEYARDFLDFARNLL